MDLLASLEKRETGAVQESRDRVCFGLGGGDSVVETQRILTSPVMEGLVKASQTKGLGRAKAERLVRCSETVSAHFWCLT